MHTPNSMARPLYKKEKKTQFSTAHIQLGGDMRVVLLQVYSHSELGFRAELFQLS